MRGLQSSEAIDSKLFIWCPEGDLNPHALLGAADFKPRNSSLYSHIPHYAALSEQKSTRTERPTCLGIASYTQISPVLRRKQPPLSPYEEGSGVKSNLKTEN
jgi:hypothetical protein